MRVTVRIMAKPGALDVTVPSGPTAEAFGIGAMVGPMPVETSALHAALVEWVAAEPFTHAPGALFVLKLEPGGPAALSGQVREGDELISVDRQKVAGLARQAVADLLHGAKGSIVKLSVRRTTFTFNVCMQRDAVRQAPPERKTRTLNPVPRQEGASEVLEKMYKGFAKVNNARVMQKAEKMTAEETMAFYTAQDAAVKRQENIAKRCIDATKRRHAEIGVLQVSSAQPPHLTSLPAVCPCLCSAACCLFSPFALLFFTNPSIATRSGPRLVWTHLTSRVGLLQRELRELEKQDAPFGQVLEYRNWIRRLQIEEELGPLASADLDLVELEAEELELQERAEYLQMTLRVLEEKEAVQSAAGISSSSYVQAGLGDGEQADKQPHRHTGEILGEGQCVALPFQQVKAAIAKEKAALSHEVNLHCGVRGAQRGGVEGGVLVMVNGQQTTRATAKGDVDIIKAKLQIVQDQLDHLRGVDVVMLNHSAVPAARAGWTEVQERDAIGGAIGGHRAAGGCEEVGASSGSAVAVTAIGLLCSGGGAGVMETGASRRSVAAGLAAELGSKWGARGQEPREGARVAAEGTLEDAPEPCMLAQGTIDTAQRLWKFAV